MGFECLDDFRRFAHLIGQPTNIGNRLVDHVDGRLRLAIGIARLGRAGLGVGGHTLHRGRHLIDRRGHLLHFHAQHLGTVFGGLSIIDQLRRRVIEGMGHLGHRADLQTQAGNETVEALHHLADFIIMVLAQGVAQVATAGVEVIQRAGQAINRRQHPPADDPQGRHHYRQNNTPGQHGVALECLAHGLGLSVGALVALAQGLAQGGEVVNHLGRALIESRHHLIARGFARRAVGLEHAQALGIELINRPAQGPQLSGKGRNTLFKCRQFLQRLAVMLLPLVCRLALAGQAGIGIELLNLCRVVAQLLGVLLSLAQGRQLMAQLIQAVDLARHPPGQAHGRQQQHGGTTGHQASNTDLHKNPSSPAPWPGISLTYRHSSQNT